MQGTKVIIIYDFPYSFDQFYACLENYDNNTLSGIFKAIPLIAYTGTLLIILLEKLPLLDNISHPSIPSNIYPKWITNIDNVRLGWPENWAQYLEEEVENSQVVKTSIKFPFLLTKLISSWGIDIVLKSTRKFNCFLCNHVSWQNF